MTGKMTIALDAMGGDAGPDMVLPGAELASVRHPDLRFILFGDGPRLEAILSRYPRLKGRSEVRHCEIAVAMDDKPSQALRRGRGKSSMWLAIDSVRTGETQGVVSAGNTGALMAMARFVLKTIPGIERPAIAAIWPTLRGESVVLDVGATIGADARQLVEFALMGEAMGALAHEPRPADRRSAQYRRRGGERPGASEGSGPVAARSGVAARI
jgi:glycerol-3-phosphate acyltransferase PlsX